MALRRGYSSRAEPDPSLYSSAGPEQPEDHSNDIDDSEELHSSTPETQPSTPILTSFCTTNGSASGEDCVHGESPIQPDNMEEDLLSEYDNVGSEREQEQDYEEDEELRTEADGMTYYVHCCPEDESYMDGMDCHEGADSSDKPSTSKDPDAGVKPIDAWKYPEGFCEGAEQKDFKRPKPISEATFIQAPMAENEEDEEEEEVEDDDDEDAVEEKEKCFVYDQEKAGHCNLLQDSRNPPQGLNYSPRKSKEDDLCNNFRVNKSISERCRGNTQKSFSGFTEVKKQVNAIKKVDSPGDCKVVKADKNPRQVLECIYKDSSDCKNCKGSEHNEASKRDLVSRPDLKKRHLYRQHAEKAGENRPLHVDNESPKHSTKKGQERSQSNYRPKSRRDRQPPMDKNKNVDQIKNEVRMKLKVEPQSTRSNKGVVEQSCDEKQILESSQASSVPSQREECKPKATDTPRKPPDSRVQKDMVKSSKEEELRSSQDQITQNSQQNCTGNLQCDTSTAASNHNPPQQVKRSPSFPSFVDVPGPCEPEDLIDGIIFAANYLGSTQLLSDRNPSKNMRMMQAQEAVDRVKCLDEENQTLVEVDLFISTKAIKVLNADTQETMIDNALRTISYIADIGSVVVLMARRRVAQSAMLDCNNPNSEGRKQYRMICYVFESEDAQLIAQSIGQAFSMAYQEFLRANGINPKDLSQKDYSDVLNSQEMYNDDLIHFSNSENCKELHLEKQKGEILGVVIVESGWGSILPTVILACMLNSGPAARSGKLNVGDQIMAVNDTSLVGLPLATCQGIIKGLKNQLHIKLSVVSCPPVTTVLIKRPELQYPLGFSVQNGIICSLMRGGIAERGGVRVGHRIIEINGQSVVAMAHEKIVHALSVSVGEIHMKTMPAVMYRLLTGQEMPVYI
ncbi:amyloid-beta A4 precursor protein-binding family A member 2 [Trichomycterus rosablanca]|uniref:amyloid-beta A4 precursor protein-binding family A member 2 n=1 Tax=Trichomycterus rosablanca TaxID=2290929 RepID=UPI002F35ACD7